ncbi:MAG: dUTP diphosphatase [Pseudoramibacter sp.]
MFGKKKPTNGVTHKDIAEKLNSEDRKNEWYKTPGWIKSGDDVLKAIAEKPDVPKKIINVQLDRGAYMPTRAHDADAGYDIRTPVQFGLLPGQYSTIDTGVHIAIPKGYVGFLKSKSGLNIKNGIVGEGVIDSGYTGSIKVKLYNFSTRNKIFELGDKIIQLVILPVYTPNLIQVKELAATERGNAGFGSTGR